MVHEPEYTSFSPLSLEVTTFESVNSSVPPLVLGFLEIIYLMSFVCTEKFSLDYSMVEV